jgi:hypothetical protein
MSATTAQRPHVVKDAKGKRPDFYETPGLDQAMSMIMVLANELAVLHDRVDSAERVMAANGINLATGIEALTLDQAALESREAWRQDFLDRLFYLMRKDAAEAARAETAASYRQTIEDIAVG